MQVHNSGYRFVEVRRSAGSWQDASWLIAPVDPDAGVHSQPPPPKDVFRRFANLQASKEYLDFANSYGLLGVPLAHADTFRWPTGIDAGLTAHAELLTDWQDRVTDMWRVTSMWHRLTNGLGFVENDALAHRVAGGWLNDYLSDDAEKKALSYPPKMQAARLARAAVENVISIVNRRLAEGAVIQLSRRGDSHTELDLKPGAPTLGLQLWTDCAEWLSGKATPRPCFRQGCSGTIDAASRRHRLFCTDSCRALHNQAVKGRALKMSKSGVTEKAILTELRDSHVTPAQLKRWLASSKRASSRTPRR